MPLSSTDLWMGFLFLSREFDEGVPKVENGYHRFFEEYAEKTSLI
jgi:beta-galactosidase